MALAAIVALGGCAAVGPDHVKPTLAPPLAFLNPTQAGSVLTPPQAGSLTTSPQAPDSTFWRRFNDPVLDELITRALAANHDIRIAAANLRQARGVRSELRGGLGPRLDASASAQRRRFSESQAPGLSTAERTDSNVDAGFDAAWEIDLFGGVRRSVEAASAGAHAAEADLGRVQLSIAAEVAHVYLSLRGQQQRLQVARANLDNQSETLRVTEVRLRAGRGSEFDVARIRVLVEATRAAVPALHAGVARDAYALSLLTGQAPGALQAVIDQPAPVPAPPRFAVADDPAAMLRRRHDVRAAESRLEAAVAMVGVRTAQLFPSVSIFGFVGLNAARASDLSHGGALTYGVGPGLTWNLLDFGRIRARIEQADAQSEAALAAYERAVLEALRDAEAALAELHHSVRQAAALAASAEAARSASRLAQVRFDAGATDLLDLLDAQRQVLNAEDQLALVAVASSGATVAVFKAFGGAWTDAELGAALR